MAAADKRVAPGTYAATRNAALNALAFLDPLKTLADRLAEADDLEGFLQSGEQARDAIESSIVKAKVDLTAAEARIKAAEARYAEREQAFAERMAAAEAKAKETAAKAQAAAEAAATQHESDTRARDAAAKSQTTRLQAEIDAKRAELSDVMRMLVQAQAAYAEFQRAAGVRS